MAFYGNEPDIYMDDETACDACGAATPRLNPPAETELCFACWQKERADEEAKAGIHINAWLDEQESAR